MLGWNRENDRIDVGQWLRGRIYPLRCDLSPDGRHLIYFAMNGRWRSPSKGSWSAISRAPYLKALAFWPKGDCWNGGGLFVSDRDYWLNDLYHLHKLARDETRLRRVDAPPMEHYGGECPGVYYPRLQRDGWALKHVSGSDGIQRSVFEKPLPFAHWVLRKTACAGFDRRQGRGAYYDEHALWNRRDERLIERPGWEWAELDRNRLVWVETGRLMTASLDKTGLGEPREIYDFNPLTWQSLEAPY
ncbi:hypothetical protein J5226_02595 [Lysobacter sp. K5869]|uniref:hypothetical protein n=1 Tax=Lysobacter sp. K5869 TaxID=2820808 RepID=UPI001C05F9E6|nr:hypothetical protein [Lysobacter sp. K5869]QWP77313.1 hypothetical protein J5226_02595 [Lysobacter sp. K5869]